MKKSVNLLAFLALLTVWGCREELPISPPQEVAQFTADIEALDGSAPLSILELQELGMRKLATEGEFYWNSTSDFELYSAVSQTGGEVLVGYKPAHLDDIGSFIHELNPFSQEFTEARQYILDQLALIYQNELQQEWNPADRLGNVDERLPVMRLSLDNYQALALLRRMPQVRYVEPYDFPDPLADPFTRSSGCGDRSSPNITSSDYFTTSPSNAKVPWNWSEMNIPNAWNTSKGAGVTIGMIDTGTSDDQPNLGSEFNNGQSNNSGRTIIRRDRRTNAENDPDDPCGHGTRMAGVLAAPRSGDGTTFGVAFQASLIAYRACNGSVINTGADVDGVSDAFTELADDNNVQIISMSLGKNFGSRKIRDAVKYAYGKGKLIFGAAGPKVSPQVVFPARMSEVQAVSGVREKTHGNYNSSLTQCSSCQKGSSVQFVVVNQDDTDNDRVSITLSIGDDNDEDDPNWSNSTSNANATVAGIAALVWSADLSQGRSQVLGKLKAASSFWPNKDNQYGYGVLDAEDAVLSVSVPPPSPPISVTINGPMAIPYAYSYTWTAQTQNATGSVSYQWFWNNQLVGSGSSYSRYVDPYNHALPSVLRVVAMDDNGSAQSMIFISDDIF